MRLAPPAEGPAASEDRGSFEAEAVACRGELYRYAVCLAGSRADAEDLVQETLLNALQSWRAFRPGTRMLSWLRTILYREFVDQYRSQRRRVDLVQQADRAAPSFLRQHGQAELPGIPDHDGLTDTLERALHRLSREHRDVVQMSDVEGFSGDETAEVLGVPVGTVKSRLFRARRILQGSLMPFALDRGYALAVAR